MAHLSIRILEGRTSEQKKDLVEDISLAIAKHIGLKPGRKVAYEWVDIPARHLAKGGEIDADSPLSAYVIISIGRERTFEERKGIAEDTTASIAKNLECPSEEVQIEFFDLYPGNVSHGGILSMW